MNPEDIERALRGEPELAPSTDFTARVMRGVWREAETRQAIPFPWKRLLSGLAACAALTLAGVTALWLRGEALPPIVDSQAIAAADLGADGARGQLRARVGIVAPLPSPPVGLATREGEQPGGCRPSRAHFFRRASNSAPGYHAGHAVERATARATTKPRRASSARPSRFQSAATSSLGRW
jgi:hypothetical protein